MPVWSKDGECRTPGCGYNPATPRGRTFIAPGTQREVFENNQCWHGTHAEWAQEELRRDQEPQEKKLTKEEDKWERQQIIREQERKREREERERQLDKAKKARESQLNKDRQRREEEGEARRRQLHEAEQERKRQLNEDKQRREREREERERQLNEAKEEREKQLNEAKEEREKQLEKDRQRRERERERQMEEQRRDREEAGSVNAPRHSDIQQPFVIQRGNTIQSFSGNQCSPGGHQRFGGVTMPRTSHRDARANRHRDSPSPRPETPPPSSTGTLERIKRWNPFKARKRDEGSSATVVNERKRKPY